MDPVELILLLICIALLIVFLVLSVVIVTAEPVAKIQTLPGEEKFKNVEKGRFLYNYSMT